MLELDHFKQPSQLSPMVDLEGVDVKGIPDARILKNLMCFMVCVELNLVNMARLVGITMLNLEKEHLKAVKWFKGTLSCGLLHRRITNDRKKLVRCVDMDCARVLD